MPSNEGAKPFPPQANDYAHVFYQVMDELARAHAKFPDQHLSWGDGSPFRWAGSVELTRMRDIVRENVDIALRDGTATWRDVIAEEFFEAAAETELDKVKAELVQVMAMCARAMVDIDKQHHATFGGPVPERKSSVFGNLTAEDVFPTDG